MNKTGKIQIWIFILFCFVITLPIQLQGLAGIKSYGKNHIWFRELPSVDSSQYLTALDWSMHNITSIPDSISQFTSIRFIDLSWNPGIDIDQVIKTLKKLPNLEALSLEFNELSQIPFSLKCLKNLKWLSLNNNEIQHINSVVFKLKILEVLVLGYEGNRMDFGNNIETWVRGKKFPHIKELYLDANYLREIPDFICSSSTLIKVSLSGNKIKKMPNCILNLNNLTFFNIASNDIPFFTTKVLNHFQNKSFYYDGKVLD